MKPLHAQIVQTFLESLTNQDDFDQAVTEKLKVLLKEKQRPKPEDYVDIFLPDQKDFS